MNEALAMNKVETVIHENKLDSRVHNLLNFDVLENSDGVSKNDDILELVFKLYKIIDLIKEGKIDKLESLKTFLLNFNIVVDYIKNIDIDSSLIKDLDKFLTEKKEKISEYMNDDNINDMLFDELSKMLLELEICYEKLSKCGSEKRGVKLVSEIGVNDSDSFEILAIDELYKKLYDALSKNDLKKITLYRGRIIRALKRNKKKINSSYDEVKCLDEINNLLISNPNISIEEISKILSKEENIKYKYYFDDCIYDIHKFKKKFDELYKKKQVKKKTLYKNALIEELKEHGRVLDERYANEFLDKKGTLTSIIKVLPNAVGLSVKKLVNTINELKEAKTNRKKVFKLLETVKDTGKVLGTPIVFLGKFATNNWYSLYMLHKGYLQIKNNSQDMVLKEDSNTNLINDEEKKLMGSKDVYNDTDINTSVDKVEVISPENVQSNNEVESNTLIGNTLETLSEFEQTPKTLIGNALNALSDKDHMPKTSIEKVLDTSPKNGQVSNLIKHNLNNSDQLENVDKNVLEVLLENGMKNQEASNSESLSPDPNPEPSPDANVDVDVEMVTEDSNSEERKPEIRLNGLTSLSSLFSDNYYALNIDYNDDDSFFPVVSVERVDPATFYFECDHQERWVVRNLLDSHCFIVDEVMPRMFDEIGIKIDGTEEWVEYTDKVHEIRNKLK